MPAVAAAVWMAAVVVAAWVPLPVSHIQTSSIFKLNLITIIKRIKKSLSMSRHPEMDF